jgi:hypothetical protein
MADVTGKPCKRITTSLEESPLNPAIRVLKVMSPIVMLTIPLPIVGLNFGRSFVALV